jgi:3-dehydroquinate synthetase
VFLVADAAVAAIHSRWLEGALGGRLRASVYIEADERFKTLSTATGILGEMQGAGLRRDSCVVGFGGGLVCDIAALCASLWLRGTRLVLVPTSLLCMADACLGGKTAVNSRRARNQIGTFFPASSVVVDVAFLDTLPQEEMRSGLGEVLKTAVISGDPALRALLAGLHEGSTPSEWASDAMESCLRAKRDVVVADPLEHGARRILNLGHTFGHALESSTGFALPHGEAVALGCIVASRMAEAIDGAPGIAGEVESLVSTLGLPHQPGKIASRSLSRFLASDKKSMRDGRAWIMPFGWGACRQVVLEPGREKELLAAALALDA